MSELNLSIHRHKQVRAAEADARAVMELNPDRCPIFSREPDDEYLWWVETFGASEQEFKEQRDALVKRWRRLRFRPWRWLERRRLMAAYIRVEGILIAPYPIQTEWR